MTAFGHYIEFGAANAPPDEQKQVRVVNAIALVSHLLNGPYLLVLLPGLPSTAPVVGVQAFALAAWSLVTALQALGWRTLARALAVTAATAHIVIACALVGDAAPVWPILATLVLVPFLVFPARQRCAMVASAIAIGAAMLATWIWLAHAPPRIPLDPTMARALAITVPFALPAFPAMIGVYYHVITTNTERALAAERARSEALLLNVLPESIANRLKAGERPIADRFDDVTVLFTDIVGFTALAEKTPPARIVAILDEMFSAFDREIARLGLEKIKTIGDAYMVAAGVPAHRDDHVEVTAELALALVRIMEARAGDGLAIRVGMHCGPVVAGVIGDRKFSYDLWGDTVNTASRMESHGVPGRVHVTGAVAARLRDRYALEPRGVIEVKGKGPMETFLLGPLTRA